MLNTINFSDLKLDYKSEINTFTYTLSDGTEMLIEVKERISVEDKMSLIAEVLNKSIDDNNFANPVKLDVYTHMAIVKYYTNIIIDKDILIPVAFDLLEENKIFEAIIDMMDEYEYTSLINDIKKTAKAYYQYKNSVYAILEDLSTNYNQLIADADRLNEIEKQFKDSESLGFLKEVMTKLG